MKNKSSLFVIILVCVIVGGAAIFYFSNSQNFKNPAVNNSTTTSQTQISSQETTNTADGKPVEKNAKALSGHDVVKTCTTDMSTQFHIHQHLVILIDKKPVVIPANIGIDIEKNCLSPVHTHDQGGILHVESPITVDFTLADFFYNWKIPFDKTGFADYKVDSTHGLKFYVNGQESQDFENLVLKNYQEIVIDYYNLSDGPGKLPPTFNWNQPV